MEESVSLTSLRTKLAKQLSFAERSAYRDRERADAELADRLKDPVAFIGYLHETSLLRAERNLIGDYNDFYSTFLWGLVKGGYITAEEKRERWGKWLEVRDGYRAGTVTKEGLKSFVRTAASI